VFRHALPTLLLALLLATSSAAAQGVSFDEAIGLADSAPLVTGEARALEARRTGDARISDITESSRVYLMPGVRAFTEEDRGFEGQIQVGHSWNIAGLADSQRRSARMERDARAAEGRFRALSQRLIAARAWLSLRECEERLRAVEETALLATRILERTERGLRGGVATQADVAEARAYLAEANAARLMAQGAIVDAQVVLGDAMGRADVESLATQGALPQPSLPAPSQIETTLRDAEGAPPVVAARLRALATDARDAELAAGRGARLDADLMAYRESPGGLLLFAQLGVQFPLADLSARDRSVLGEQSALLEAQAEQEALAWQRQSHSAAHEVEHTRGVAALLEGELVPSFVTLVDARERQLSAGETTVLILLDATRRLVDARVALSRALTERTWAEMRAWLLLSLPSEGDGGTR